MKKLQAREIIKEKKKTVTIDVVPEIVESSSTTTVQKTTGVVNAFSPSDDAKSRDRAMTLDSLSREVSFLKIFEYFSIKNIFRYYRMQNVIVQIHHQVFHHHQPEVLQVYQTVEHHPIQQIPQSKILKKKKMNVVVQHLHLNVEKNLPIHIIVVHHYQPFGLMVVLIKFIPLVVLIYFMKVIVFFFNVCDNSVEKLLSVYMIVEVYIN
jgi:hypothetical protein